MPRRRKGTHRTEQDHGRRYPSHHPDHPQVQANVDFYVGFLGLRPRQANGRFRRMRPSSTCSNGDAIGSPGSLVTFLVWGRRLAGPSRLWPDRRDITCHRPDEHRLLANTRPYLRLRPEGPSDEFGEPVLRLKDPDGVIVKLVGTPRPLIGSTLGRRKDPDGARDPAHPRRDVVCRDNPMSRSLSLPSCSATATRRRVAPSGG